MMKVLLLLAFSLNDFAHAQPRPIEGVVILEMDEFKAGIDAGQFDVILDVRTQSEWDNIGRIEGATLAENLGSFGSTTISGASPADFQGCEFCTIAVYCQSGARASNALQVLVDNGFEGDLYNGQGTIEWAAVGYDLVFDVPSVEPPCTLNDEDQCAAVEDGVESPSSGPSSSASALPTTAPSGTTDNNESPTVTPNEGESSSPSWAWSRLTIAAGILSFALY